MIFTIILSGFYNFLAYLVSLAPVGSLPSGIISAVNYFWGALNSFSYIFPVSTLIQVLIIMLGFDLAVLLWHLFNWVIRKIPGMQ